MIDVVIRNIHVLEHRKDKLNAPCLKKPVINFEFLGQ